MVHIERDYLIAPRELPDGTVSWDEQRPDLAQRIRQGDPVYGWEGDERLSLHVNTEYHDPADGYTGPAWEVWRRHESGEASLVMRKKGLRMDDAVLLRLLAAADTRHVDVVARVAAENASLQADLDRNFGDHVEDKADKLAHALGKDLDVPAQDGKVYPVA